MKKVIATIGIMAMCLGVNAATATWSALKAGTELSTGDVASGVKAFLFDSVLAADVLQSIANGTWTEGANALYTKNTTVAGAITQAGVGSFENETVSFSMILLNADSYASATEFKYAEVKDVVFVTSNKTLNFTQSLSSAQWTAIVPEPTSGLLMLVGLAGLALRRRRA